jgi:hypothetical protein
MLGKTGGLTGKTGGLPEDPEGPGRPVGSTY